MADSDTTGFLSPERRRFIDTLLASGDVDQAAAAAGVSPRTGHRWRNEPAVRAALVAAQDAALDQTTGALVAGSLASVALLRRVVDDDLAQLSHRLRAAATLLDATLRWHELRNLAQRVTVLEQRITGNENVT